MYGCYVCTYVGVDGWAGGRMGGCNDVCMSGRCVCNVRTNATLCVVVYVCLYMLLCM